MADDPPDLEELAKVHPGIWMEHFGFILSKTRDLIRPALNVLQARAVAAYAWCLTNGIAPRLMGLKPRQVGGTTVFAGLLPSRAPVQLQGDLDRGHHGSEQQPLSDGLQVCFQR